MHRLTEINSSTKSAQCSECGEVDIRFINHRNHWRCRNVIKKDKERHREKTIKQKTSSKIWLYKAFGNDDSLLYVGITDNPSDRFRRHKSNSVWWTSHNRMELTQLETYDREEARKIEEEIIKSESPLFNILHN